MKNLLVFILIIILLSGCDFLFPNKGKDEIFVTDVISDSGATVAPLKAMTQKGENAFFSYSLKNGYELVSIIVDGVSITPINNSFTLTDINSDGKVYITTKQKEKQKFVISINYGPGGKVDPSGDVIVTEGENQTVNIISDPGFIQDVLKINGVTTTPTTSYNFLNVTSNGKLDATFKNDPLFWPLYYIEWREDSTYVDQNKYYIPDGEILNIYPNGTYVRTVRGEVRSPEKLVLDRTKNPVTIIYGGVPYNIEEINEKSFIISNRNEYNQKVSLIFKNNKYKQQP